MGDGESLTGQDIKNRSGVLTCQTPLTARYGPLCVGSDGGARTLDNALSYCAGFGLGLPSFSEASTLARNYDVPGVSGGQGFWTDALFLSGNNEYTWRKRKRGSLNFIVSELHQTVCVTDPSA